MIEKKNLYALLFVFVLFAGGVLYFLVSNPNGRDISEIKEGKQQTKKEKGTLKKTKKEKKKQPDGSSNKTVHIKADVPFSKYKKYYQKSTPNSTPELVDKSSFCNKQALIEFIFVKKKRGSIVPYKFKRGIEFERGQRGTSEYEDFILPGGPDPDHFRFLLSVGIECDSSSAPNPGEVYKLTYLGGETGYNYKIKIPEKEELKFIEGPIPEDATVQDLPVYRWPIFVGDVLKTKKTKEPAEPIEKTIVVNGVEDKGAHTNVSYVQKIQGPGSGYQSVQFHQMNQGTWKGKVKNEADQGAVLGGSIAVYIGSGEDKEHPWIKLIQLKKNIQKKFVDLSEGLDFYHRDQKWIEKQVQLDRYINEIRNNLHKSVRDKVQFEGWSVTLVLQNSLDMPVYSTKIKKQGKHYVAKLKAPRGTYHLKASGDRMLEKNFKWPPE